MARTSLTTVLAAAALGAAAMYVFDPDKGRRRRAIGRDKIRRAVGDARRFVDVAARDTSYRLQGMRALAARRFRREPLADDLQLIERVRARMGRVVSHPHAIQIGANRGCVTLSGHILQSEVGPLLDTVRSVWGVESVEDHLVAHDTAQSVPSLQGGVLREARPEILQENWAPALRLAAMTGGGLLALYGMKSRSLSGCVLTTIGVALAARGAVNRPLDELTPGTTTQPRALEASQPLSSDAQPAASID